jgi:katanin p60 ATPase-containing subunit A1
LKGIPVSEKINWDELIRITDGYSGADLANVCRDAAMMPLRRKMSQGIDILKIKEFQDEVETPLMMEDFLEAIKNVSKSVSQDQLNDYAEWMKQFGSV